MAPRTYYVSASWSAGMAEGYTSKTAVTFRPWKYLYSSTESEQYVPEQRTEYIHQHPVRAGIVDNAEDYVGSRARFYFSKKCLIELAPV